eukprot:TRINITY_DN61427_c0_g1_i1.p1 TRINITY_DN61427_c0_g1~~TRINITY_DN61427_c0_g1_i1.p1  ORF type:complete len:801 (+),score=127.15 TRINITY_DN61427_c0_g1_i1:175-2577(+)
MAWFFRGADSEAVDPPVPPGHQGVDVHINGQVIRADVDMLAEWSGLFLQIQASKADSCPLEDFPGGIVVFREIVNLFVDTEPKRSLSVSDSNVLHMFEAAWLLECPMIFDEVMDSPYMHALSSRRKVELLEQLLPFTQASNSTEFHGSVEGPATSDEFMRIFLLETQMWQKSERAAMKMAMQLDIGDFVLGPRLATGSLRVCCDLLRLHQRRSDDVSFVVSALQPVASLWKNFTDKPLRAKVNWDSHLFALMCIRKRLTVGADADAALEKLAGEHEEDEEARTDISEELCASVDDGVLLGLAELVGYVQLSRTPPNWTALLIRTLILNDRLSEAKQAFTASFANSKQLQELAWKPRPKVPVVPVSWLADVAEDSEACRVLLRILGRYREMEAEELCDIIENVLLNRFLLVSSECGEAVLASELVNDIVGACFDAASKASAPRVRAGASGEAASTLGADGVIAVDGYTQVGRMNADVETSTRNAGRPCKVSRCPPHWAGQHILQRLSEVGSRLFAAAFVPQCGFLPHQWPDCLGESPVLDGCDPPASAAMAAFAIAAESPAQPRETDRPCRPEPLSIPVVGHCLWDEDLLSIGLLHATMDAGRAAPREPKLHYGRQVIMRHLWRCQEGGRDNSEVTRLGKLWELACWPLCEDAGLIREALEYLKGVYRDLLGDSTSWCPEKEEALFAMFCALDLCRLPVQALLSPWVPVQVQTVRLLVQQQPAEQFHSELHQEVVNAQESLKSVNSQCVKLSNRLNIVEQRTVINKSQINDAIVAIEEHQRQRREAALPPRRALTTSGSSG